MGINENIMTHLEISYKIKERSEDYIKEHGSIENAIEYLKIQLKECDNLWSEYSCDCLGHAITCNTLLIKYLENILK